MTIMTVPYALSVGLLLAVAALMLEHAMAWTRLPRRWVWVAALVSTLALTFWLPWRTPAASSDVAITSATGTLATVATRVGRWWSSPNVPSPAARLSGLVDRFGLIAWAAASMVMIATYAAGVLTLRRRRTRWPAAALGPYRVLVSDDVGPAVIGFWRASIVVPEWALTLEPPHLELLLHHEREHQLARDSVLVHVAELALVAMPWNPAVWWVRARLRAAIELDCDARVLAALAPGGESLADLRTYGDLLLTVASHSPARSPAVVPALIERPSVLKRRILAMQPMTRRLIRSRLATIGLVAAGLVMAAVMLPAPALHAQYDQQRGAYRAKTPGLKNPTVITTVKPIYTTDARRARIEGEVQLEAIVAADGTIAEPRITKSLDRAHGLDEQALKAARQWTFRPATLEGEPVPVIVTLEMTFKLR